MNSFHLKIIAIVTMLIDHIGLFFFPSVSVLRIIGRISFPLFAFLVANGARHTKNINAYFYRLFSLGLLSQIPFYMANSKIGETPNKLNVLFTLSFGLLVIMIMKKYKSKFIWVLAAILASTVALVLNFDYQIVGILSVVGFYLFYDKPVRMIIMMSVFFVLPVFVYFLYFPQNIWQIMMENMYFAPFALLSLFFIFLFNNKEGPKMKYLFYVIYPLQYVFYLLFL